MLEYGLHIETWLGGLLEDFAGLHVLSQDLELCEMHGNGVQDRFR